MFSIVIPVRSVNAYLRENIYYLKRLDYPNFEVIVVLDEEEDTSFVDDDRFRFMISGPLGPGEKRNLGVYAADGEIIAFLDDDAFPSNDWLTKAAAIFENSNIYALGAPAVTPKNAQFLERVSGKVLESVLVSGNTVYRHRKVRRRLIDDYPTVNLFVRREDFIEVGGFVEEFWPGEDTKLCLDLVESKGKKFVYDPRPVVYHHRRNVFLPHLKQISRYGQHRGQFAKIFPKTSRLISYFIPSLFALGVIIGPVVCLLYPNLWSFYFGVIGFYAFLVVWSALKVFFESWNVFEGLFVLLGIVATHFVYGINFMIGFIRRPKLKLRAVDQTSGSYVGG